MSDTFESGTKSGLDMANTISWYEMEKIDLPLPNTGADSSLPSALEEPELTDLKQRELEGLFSLFPENARQRSILNRTIAKPSLWFDNTSSEGHQNPTHDINQALTETAIIPSYVDFSEWRSTGTPKADIWLHSIPKEVASNTVRKTILGQGFVHEVGHTIVNPALYIEDYKLKLPGGNIVSGFDFAMQFAQAAESYPPISHYASFFRGTNNKFEFPEDSQQNPLVSIIEEMCETIAAYLLGFAYNSSDENQGKSPLEDRPEVRKLIVDFLNAEKAS